MNIQYEKAKKKIGLICEHTLGLSEYNSLVNYENIKEYSIIIDYFSDKRKNNFCYEISIIRGTNNPKSVFKIRLMHEEKINDLLIEFINNLVKSDLFSYSSFIKEIEKATVNKFMINLKNNVSVYFPIKDKEDITLYNNINKKIKETNIINKTKINKTCTKNKDILQYNKAKKILMNIENIFNYISDLNNLTDYDNKKPYSLEIIFNNNLDYDIISINLIRGNINPEKIMNYTISIKDIRLIHNIIYDFSLNFINKNEFIYTSTETNDYMNAFNIKMNNMLNIKFIYSKESEKELFNKLFKISKSNKIYNKKLTKSI